MSLEMILKKQILPRIKISQNGCWEWQGCKNHKGYGYIRINGRKGKNVSTHRTVYEYYFGKIPIGLYTDHLCRNRPCCNPTHLEAVTPKENALRGFGQGALNLKKTHCPKNHPYSDDNTRITYGRRRCRICLRSYKKRG